MEYEKSQRFNGNGRTTGHCRKIGIEKQKLRSFFEILVGQL